MGRVRNQRTITLDGTEPVEGVETKGKLFFEKPILTVVGKEEIPVVQSYHHNSPMNTSRSIHDNVGNPNSKVGPVRLLSSHNYQVCTQERRPKEVEYALNQYPTHNQVLEYLKLKRVDGFGTGAVVARRYQNEWRYKVVHQWGIIMFEIANPTMHQLWAPYSVKWLEGDVSEKAWAEDLVVIHSHMDMDYITDILETQGIEFFRATN
jgi:hypothetical protein